MRGSPLSHANPFLNPAACLPQPSSIEFDFALEWRQLEGQLAYAKRALCLEQAAELAEHLAVYVEVGGCGFVWRVGGWMPERVVLRLEQRPT